MADQPKPSFEEGLAKANKLKEEQEKETGDVYEPFEKWRVRTNSEITRRYGPRVADYFFATINGRLTAIGGMPVDEQKAELDLLETRISLPLQDALISDRKQRQEQFRDYIIQTLVVPRMGTGDPQDAVTLTGIDALLPKWEQEYEQMYQEALFPNQRNDLQEDDAITPFPGVSLMADFIQEKSRSLMGEVRPELRATNSYAVQTGFAMTQQAAQVGTQIRRLAQAEKQYDAYMDIVEQEMRDVIRSLRGDTTGKRQRLIGVYLQQLADPGMRQDFLELNKTTPTPANTYLDANLSPFVKSAVRGGAAQQQQAKPAAPATAPQAAPATAQPPVAQLNIGIQPGPAGLQETRRLEEEGQPLPAPMAPAPLPTAGAPMESEGNESLDQLLQEALGGTEKKPKQPLPLNAVPALRLR